MKPSFPGISPDLCYLISHSRLDADGCPIISNGKGGKSKSHRITYGLFFGRIPQATMVLHSCGHAQCINPHHLYLGDRAAHGRTAKGFRLPRTRLSDADVLAIRSSSKRVKDLAQQFGVSTGCVSSIRSMRQRASVQPSPLKVEG